MPESVSIVNLHHDYVARCVTIVNGFTILAEFTESGYSIGGTDISIGSDIISSTHIVMEGAWADNGRSLGDFFGEDVAVISLVNGNGTGNAPFKMDLVQLEAIPEPAAMTLVLSFGVGLLVIRRLFKLHV